MQEIEKYSEKIFEDIKHTDEFGNEYWEARELMKVLDYSKWSNFKKVIDKAKITCKVSNNRVEEHFTDVGKVLSVGNNAKMMVDSYNLSRYACYLIVQNANPNKEVVALGQTYFAVQTRKMELTEKEFLNLNEDEKRLYTRISVRNKNKYLFGTAKKAGVKNYGKFNDYGYKGLYNGETAKDIAKRKEIDENKDILDYMGSAELGANLFRITQTDELLKENNVNTERDACSTHYKVGKTVRKAIKELGSRMPEDLPTPKKSMKELERDELVKLSNN